MSSLVAAAYEHQMTVDICKCFDGIIDVAVALLFLCWNVLFGLNACFIIVFGFEERFIKLLQFRN